jgi:ABC-type multidrug transport system fused ATPase/permease subunit
VTLLAALFVGMTVTYVAKEVIDALSAGERETALWYVLYGIGGVLIVSQLMMGYQAFNRELAWNNNYQSVVTNLSRLFFMRTAGEMVAEDNEVGAEQVESAKDRIQNILYMILFEGPTFVLGMVAAALLVFTVDIYAGVIIVALIAFNIGWFLYFNSLIDEKMDEIDRGFRRANRRMIERWNFALSTKTNGVEEKVCAHINDEVTIPLAADRAVWAYWFIPIDVVRGCINNSMMVLILCYGVGYASWSGGDFAAVFVWLTMIIDRFGYIGHLMRHLTSQVVRVRAVRTVLESSPVFRHDEGIVYQGGTTNAL